MADTHQDNVLTLQQAYDALVAGTKDPNHHRHFKETYEHLQLPPSHDTKLFLDLLKDNPLDFLNRLPPKLKTINSLKKPRYAFKALVELPCIVEKYGTAYCASVEATLKACFEEHGQAIADARSRHAVPQQQPRAVNANSRASIADEDDARAVLQDSEDDAPACDEDDGVEHRPSTSNNGLLRQKDAAIASLKRQLSDAISANKKLRQMLGMLLDLAPQDNPYVAVIKAVPDWISPP